MIRRKTRKFRKKLRLLTNAQHRQSIRFGLYVRAWADGAKPLFAYVNGWA
jgi:hypothetical protein